MSVSVNEIWEVHRAVSRWYISGPGQGAFFPITEIDWTPGPPSIPEQVKLHGKRACELLQRRFPASYSCTASEIKQAIRETVSRTVPPEMQIQTHLSDS
jgi:hypothetical protein